MAAAATVDPNHLQPPLHSGRLDSLWDHDRTTWLTDLGILVLLGAAFLAVTWWRLERLRPGRRTRL